MVVTTYQMLLGGISMSVVALATGERITDFLDATLFSWMWWLFLVLIGSIATYSAYLWLVKYAPVGLIATYAYVNPVIAVTIGAIVLNEKLSTTLLIGAAVVITGVVMVVRAESRAVATQVQPSA
jgi:drug/metabolite transporter (DMT)-like permease